MSNRPTDGLCEYCDESVYSWYVMNFDGIWHSGHKYCMMLLRRELELRKQLEEARKKNVAEEDQGLHRRPQE